MANMLSNKQLVWSLNESVTTYLEVSLGRLLCIVQLRQINFFFPNYTVIDKVTNYPKYII